VSKSLSNKFFSFAIFILLLAFFNLNAQTSINPTNTPKWSVKAGVQKVFIENKGQFDNLISGTSVYYGENASAAMVLFTDNGLIYRFRELITKKEKASEGNEKKSEREEEEERAKNTREHIEIIQLQWLNANKVIPQLEETVSDYYVYAGEGSGTHIKTIRAIAGKKLVYHNLYRGIDVEYIFHPREGLEYSIIVHPGADPTQVKMTYAGAKKQYLDKDGHVHIVTTFGDIIDHTPLTFDNSTKVSIPSGFQMKGKSICCNLSNYDTTHAIVIDPWVIDPGLTAQDLAYDIAQDAVGNLYVAGGGTNFYSYAGDGGGPYQVQKYTPSGALVWTYTLPAATTAGNFLAFGGFAVDNAGNSFITDGANSGTVLKLNTVGNLVWSNANGYPNELWRLSFNCNFTTLYCAQGGFATSTAPNVINTIDLTNGSLIAGTPPLAGPYHVGQSEPRAMTCSSNGNIYVLTCRDFVNGFGQLIGISPSLSVPFLFSVPNSYILFFYEGATYGPSNPGQNTVQGQNAITTDKNFIYTSDGATLIKWNISTGVQVSSTVIPGGMSQLNSGVIVDTCGYIYVGSQAEVVKYDNNLNLITSYATSGAVYGMCFGTDGQVVACGNGFVASFNANACTLTQKAGPDTTVCAGAKVQLQATGGNSYSWDPSPDLSNTNIPNPIASPGASNKYVVSISTDCIVVQDTVTINVLGIRATASSSLSTISPGSTSTLSATGGDTYQWYPPEGLSCITCPNPIASPQQTTEYCVLVTSANNCTDSACTTIKVEILCGEFFIPTAFSPNGDGQNDMECVKGNCIETFHLSIYDRWGELVFETTNPSVCWDGKYRGRPLDAAVFSYYLTGTLTTGQNISKKGNITLLR
jgi:gliding motility-associated-like protein